MPVSVDQQAGRKALISLCPAWNPTSSVDLANLATFIASCASNGVQADVILWPNPSTAGMTATQYAAMIAYYGPTVRASYPLVYHGLASAATAGSAATFTSYYPGDGAVDKVMVTYSAAAYEAGVTLDGYASVADNASTPKPFGIAELAANDTVDTIASLTAFFTYIQSFMTTRTAGGKNNGDVLWYNETPTSTSTWSTIGNADPQVALYDSLYDALTGTIPVVTVSFTAGLALTATITPVLAGGTGSGVTPPPGQPPTVVAASWPRLFLEAGFIATSPVPAASTLLLGDPTLGILGTGTLGAATLWTDLSGFMRSGGVSRTSTRQQGPLWTAGVGTMSATLKDDTAAFDPSNLAGPFVAAGVTQVRPMVPIRVRAMWGGTVYPLFSGYVDSWVTPDTNWGPRYAETGVSASDGFKVLANIQRTGLTQPTGDGENTGARIRRILDSAGWSPTDRLIDTGDTLLQGTVLSGDPLSEMQLAVDTELGQLYVSGEGRVVFRHRQAPMEDPRSAQVQAVFGDSPGNAVTTFVITPADLYAGSYADAYGGGTATVAPGTYTGTYTDTYPGSPTGFFELPYDAVGRAGDDTTLVNDVQITRVGGTLQEYTDQSSVAQFLFPRSYSRTDLLLETDAEAAQYARYVAALAKGGENRFDTLTINPLRDPANLWPQVLGRDIGDRIQVWRRPPGMGGTPIVKDVFITGITHTWSASPLSWQTQWTLQDASRFQFVVLGDTKLGVLGAYPLAY